jgi:hypothetical protein
MPSCPPHTPPPPPNSHHHQPRGVAVSIFRENIMEMRRRKAEKEAEAAEAAEAEARAEKFKLKRFSAVPSRIASVCGVRSSPMPVVKSLDCWQ